MFEYFKKDVMGGDSGFSKCPSTFLDGGGADPSVTIDFVTTFCVLREKRLCNLEMGEWIWSEIRIFRFRNLWMDHKSTIDIQHMDTVVKLQPSRKFLDSDLDESTRLFF